MTNTNIPQNLTENKKHSVMGDYALMLFAPLFVAFFIHGVSAIRTVAISVFTCALCSFFGKKTIKTETSIKDISGLIVGVMVALLLPSNTPWWVTVLTGIFAVAVCILPFGTFEKAPFPPAAAAFCFASLCWPDVIFNYSSNGMSLAKMLTYGNAIDGNSVAILEILIGNVPSALGTGCVIALFGSLAFLLVRRPKDTVPVFAFIAAVCIMAFLFPRTSSGRFVSVIMEFCSGMLFFSAVFFMSSPNNMPEKFWGKFVWGLTSGIICMLIRYVNFFEESVAFGILISCSISDYFDKLPYTKKEKMQIKANEPYTEIEIPTVVPEEILNEIPDLTPYETTDTPEETDIRTESLELLISEEGSLSQQEPPFFIGGDSNE